MRFGSTPSQMMRTSGIWIPWSSCRNYTESCLAGAPPLAIIIIGQLAQSIVRIAVQEGKVQRGGDLLSTNAQTKVLDISSEFFVEHYERILTQFGWTFEELDDGQSRLWHEFQQRWNQGRKRYDPQLRALVNEVVSGVYGDCLNTPRGDFMTNVYDLAMHVAVQALSVLTHHPYDNQERQYVPNMSFSSYDIRGDLLARLWSSNGMNINLFQEVLLKVVLSISTLRGDELIIENNGMVVVRGTILNPTLKQSGACALGLFPGMIKKEHYRYNCVRQTIAGGTRRSSGTPLQMFRDGGYTGLEELPMPFKFHPQLEFFTTLKGPEIFLRSVIHFHNQGGLGAKPNLDDDDDDDDGNLLVDADLDWIKASQNLAIARHLSRFDQCSRATEEALAKSLRDDQKLARVVWIDSKYHKAEDKYHERSVFQLIACTGSDDILRLYQLSLERECDYVVQNDGALIKALKIAMDFDDWVIIT